MFEFISNATTISVICISCIVAYYIVSAFFIMMPTKKWLQRGGFIDWVTSIIWLGCAGLLIFSLFYLCTVQMTIKLGSLVVYYFLFIFLFAIIYGLLDWHWPTKMFDGIAETGKWKAEGKYLLISMQTQTTLGYTNVKPKTLGVEILTCIHALLGIFFLTIFISLSINAFTTKDPQNTTQSNTANKLSSYHPLKSSVLTIKTQFGLNNAFSGFLHFN